MDASREPLAVGLHIRFGSHNGSFTSFLKVVIPNQWQWLFIHFSPNSRQIAQFYSLDLKQYKPNHLYWFSLSHLARFNF